jgi:uncharacterized protein
MLPGMHFAREECSSERLIRACEPGMIRIGLQQFRRSLIVSPAQVLPDWRPRQADDLLRDDFDPVLALEPDILLLGTGDRLRFPSPALTADLLRSGIGVEVMDTAAACRTFNVLLSEQRRVVAALLLG